MQLNLFKRYRHIIVGILFTITILYMGGFFTVFAGFLRTGELGDLVPASNPDQISYGYGLGDNGRGRGTGKGYISGDVMNNSNARYALGVQDHVAVTTSGNATAQTGNFSAGAVDVEIPVDTIVTVGGNAWDGIMDIPAYTTSYGLSNPNDIVQGVVNLNFNVVGGAIFSKPVKIIIPVIGTTPTYVRIQHDGVSGLTTLGLTRSATSNCAGGLSDDPYNGGTITVSNNTVTIYTCRASTFVAYTTPSNSNNGGGGGGGGGGAAATPQEKDICPNGDLSPSKYDGTCLPERDYCPSGDLSPSLYDGSCKATKKDICPKGDLSASFYDGTCDKPKVKTIISSGVIENNLLSGDASSGAIVPSTSSGAIVPSTTNDPNFTQEYNDAYNFALSKGLTTMSTIAKANMKGDLTRAAMAKMIVNYAINVLGRTLDTTAKCNFTDMSKQTQEMKDYATKACQLGLMGKDVTTFKPNNLVTRAQLGTVLSRMLYNTPDSGKPYYTVHLSVLQTNGVIKDTTPTRIERRAYLMLMLMRAASK
ncbi:MAG: S-layer homology domain-containing protein [candidate division SR1 bacterium]|nr:S-layer homology domain-containing protein [candidate division SR1 bacterium]